jgi:predicted hydrocarbon binding protein
MPPSGNSKAPFDRFPDGRGSRHDATAGIAQVPNGARVVFASPALLRALHTVLAADSRGAWQKTNLAGGLETGRAFGLAVDQQLAARGQPALADQPLETCLAVVERHFAAQGWGLLACDVSLAAEHGVVIARLKQSAVVAALGPGDDFVDALPGGFLEGFLGHVSGQPLSCLEIGCARTGVPHCTFVITSGERLESVAPLLGRASPDEIIAKLKT